MPVKSCNARIYSFFFFQAEDGIRDATVTGVQTCALPILRRSVEASRRRRIGNAGVRAGAVQSDPPGASETGLCLLRTHRTSGSTEPSDRARRCRSGTSGACAGLEILRPLAVVSPVGNLRARRRGAGTLNVGGLGGRNERVAHAAGGSTAAS